MISIQKLNRWGLSILLLIPVFLLYGSHVYHATPEKIPSYFLQDDMPYYMAVAREYFDAGDFSFTYGNPFSPHSETPRHYFQPITLLLGIIWNFTKINPGILFLSLGVFTSLLGVRASIALFEFFHPLRQIVDLLILLLWIWGGGLLSLGGAYWSYTQTHQLNDWLIFDPSDGWWFLNLGRNFIYPLESLYHFLFFQATLFFLRKKWSLALITLALLSISHPFTGVQLLLISSLWLTIEHLVGKKTGKDHPPFWTLIATATILLIHLGYYIFFLGKDPEHHSIMEAWKISFSMHGITFLLNLLPLFFIFIWGVRHRRYSLQWFTAPSHRFLLVGFLVTLALVFHDRLIPPIQPLHFDRGYLWTFLFFIILPPFSVFIGKIKKLRIAPILLLLLTLIFLSDNLSWISFHILTPTGYYHTVPQKELFDWLEKNTTNHDLLISDDQIIGYLAPTYCSTRVWYAFWWFTPFSEQSKATQKKFFDQGIIPSEWQGRSILVMQTRQKLPLKTTLKTDLKKLKLFENQNYLIWQLRP